MTDFLLDDSGDLRIENGDLVMGESTRQHQVDIIEAHKGWYKEAAVLGVGLSYYLLDEGAAPGLTSSIRRELERDGQTVILALIDEGGLTVDAYYE